MFQNLSNLEMHPRLKPKVPKFSIPPRTRVPRVLLPLPFSITTPNVTCAHRATNRPRTTCALCLKQFRCDFETHIKHARETVLRLSSQLTLNPNDSKWRSRLFISCNIFPAFPPSHPDFETPFRGLQPYGIIWRPFKLYKLRAWGTIFLSFTTHSSGVGVGCDVIV